MFKPPDVLETRRMLLRRASTSHATEAFHRWTQDPEVTRFLVWRPHGSVDETRAFLGHCEAAWNDGSEFVWFFQEQETGKLMGSISARPDDHGVELGYLTARDWWGRGFMTEAVEAVTAWWLGQENVHRVWATCDVENRASARVLEKAGFTLEGTLRKWDRHPNVSEIPRDSLCFSRVRD